MIFFLLLFLPLVKSENKVELIRQLASNEPKIGHVLTICGGNDQIFKAANQLNPILSLDCEISVDFDQIFKNAVTSQTLIVLPNEGNYVMKCIK